MAQNSQAVIPDNIILVDGELNPVPTPAAGDSGKVLTVVDSDGTIGWSPVSASGTQLQADWSVTDDTSVQYIAHKPDLSVYATSSDVTTALAGKQDTISDLNDIRSGAAAGATAVQPADLADYVEASSLAAVATSGSYNDLIDTPTIPSGDDLVPSATSADEGKVLTVNASGNAVWATPATPSVDEVPAVTSSDNGKVLKATYSGGVGSYAWDTAPGGTTYTAGNMISINGNNAIGVSTTAGITDIQQVNVLPANPVSTVLYLIPET